MQRRSKRGANKRVFAILALVIIIGALDGVYYMLTSAPSSSKAGTDFIGGELLAMGSTCNKTALFVTMRNYFISFSAGCPDCPVADIPVTVSNATILSSTGIENVASVSYDTNGLINASTTATPPNWCTPTKLGGCINSSIAPGAAITLVIPGKCNTPGAVYNATLSVYTSLRDENVNVSGYAT